MDQKKKRAVVWGGWLLAVVSLLLAGACTPLLVGGSAAGGYKVATEERSVGQLMDDATVSARVKTALIKDDQVQARHIDVDTVDGVVYLNGYVENQEQRRRAARLAAGIAGVRRVENRLRIGSRSLSQALDDQLLAAKVKTRLIGEPGIRALNIDVDAYQAEVSLTGLVENRDQKKKVLGLVRGIPGVAGVVDNLQVRH